MEQRSEEWFAARRGRVTASMVGAILGLNPYMGREDAMRAMVRESLGLEREFSGNVATEWGTYNEAGALVEYRIKTTHDVEPAGFIAFEDWAGASPDGLVGDTGGVEIKCPYSLRAAPQGEPVPFKPLADQPHYYAQVQFTLYVTGRKWWHFFQWCPADVKLEPALPDPEWQADNIPRLRQFHAEYLHELDHNPDEYRLPKRKTLDTPEAHKMVAEWDELTEQAERLAERKADLLDSMVSMAGGDAWFAGRKLTQVERAGSVAYARAVKEHLPKLDLQPYRGKASRYWKLT